jgi:Flp pilus assembly protein TadG
MRLSHCQRGSTIVEFALAMGALLALCFGIIDFGRALYTYSFVTTAAREGTRWAAVRGSNSCTNSNNTLSDCNASAAQIQSYVQSLSEGATSPSQMTVTPTWPNCTVAANGAVNAPGCIVSVNVTYNFKFMLPFMPKVSIPFSTTSQLAISQ